MRKEKTLGGNATPAPGGASIGRGTRRKEMGSIAGEEAAVGGTGSGGGGKEERILVSVRIRPLNEKEIERNDTTDWECTNNNTVISKNGPPASYTFDRVFGCNSTTKQVYDEGAKEVALSVVGGINSSIFAYGQTSSGKTYTMRGITWHSVSEIYAYIQRHEEREFVIKFSAMEIYNEAVKDLLNPENGPLRLLDDPEKGTIVERLTEERLRDQDHLKELLSICEAQRQIGETSLNELSSRSHQILRLSIESSPKEFTKNNFSTLSATVNFVDLAGSERASQALTAGSRLKEGCHINRSLLTLGSVIRKLSKGRNEHIPYRDSKLTRILQSSLGGNARTAIICTMSPARIHMEQTRNTLQFASAAKEVVNSAHVNVVMSDKALVKHLRKELARLEKEMRSMGSASITCPDEILKEKETQIQKMEKEMKELMQQRDLARSRIDDLLRSMGDDQDLRQLEKLSQSPIPHSFDLYEDSVSTSEASGYEDSVSTSEASGYTYQIPDGSDTPSSCSEQSTQIMSSEISQFTSQVSDDNCREIQCMEIVEPNLSSNHESITKSLKEMINESVSLSPKRYLSSSKALILHRNSSCMAAMRNSANSPWFEEVEESENTPPNSILKDCIKWPRESKRISPINRDAEMQSHSKNGSENSEMTSFDGDVLKPENLIDEQKEVAQYQYRKETDNHQDSGIKIPVKDVSQDPVLKSPESPIKWELECEKKKLEIVELWHACNVSLVHRSYFFLLMKGDPSDSIYMEVEHRRLAFLKSSSQNAHHELSLKNLRHERRKFTKLMKGLPISERESLYTKWCISLNSKQRRRQLARRMWTETNDMEHAQESAIIVEKLFGLVKRGLVFKEMFALSFTQFS